MPGRQILSTSSLGPIGKCDRGSFMTRTATRLADRISTIAMETLRVGRKPTESFTRMGRQNRAKGHENFRRAMTIPRRRNSSEDTQ